MLFINTQHFKIIKNDNLAFISIFRVVMGLYALGTCKVIITPGLHVALMTSNNHFPSRKHSSSLKHSRSFPWTSFSMYYIRTLHGTWIIIYLLATGQHLYLADAVTFLVHTYYYFIFISKIKFIQHFIFLQNLIFR